MESFAMACTLVSSAIDRIDDVDRVVGRGASRCVA
jgi:hypothetical protein